MAEAETKVTSPLAGSLRELFRTGLSARAEDLGKINAWAKANTNQLFVGEVDSDTVAGEIGVPNQDVYRALQLIGTLLFRGDPPGSLEVEGYSAALEDPDLSFKAHVLLDGIQLERGEAEYARLRGMVSQMVLPTLGSATALCELRAVFHDVPSPSTSKTHKQAVSTLLGFEPMVVVNMEINDPSGNDTNFAFQVTEKGLRNILRTFQDALAQLEIIREYHESQRKSLVRS